jgi:hypothetical protein
MESTTSIFELEFSGPVGKNLVMRPEPGPLERIRHCMLQTMRSSNNRFAEPSGLEPVAKILLENPGLLEALAGTGYLDDLNLRLSVYQIDDRTALVFSYEREEDGSFKEVGSRLLSVEEPFADYT